jgi:adenylylsulfate kinase
MSISSPLPMRGQVIWLLGPTSAGKTTIGKLYVEMLRAKGLVALHYDGDEIRGFFGSNLGFRPEDRLRAVSVCAHLAGKAAEAGVAVVVSALTANEDARAYIREHIKNLILVYLECPLSVCVERDSRGLYQKAQTGEIDPDTIIGWKIPYNPPQGADLVVDTSKYSAQESVELIYSRARGSIAR